MSFMRRGRVSRSQACIVGFAATSDVSATGQGSPSAVVTMPPASRIRRTPAAMSHGARRSSQNASNRPQATSARSSAAAPGRRMPAVARMTRGSGGKYSSMSLVVLEGKAGADQRARRLGDRRDADRLRRRGARRRRAVAVNSSPVATLRTTPAASSPSTSAAIDTAYHGKPWRKFVVPSSGSATNDEAVRAAAAFGEASSPRSVASGCRPATTSAIAASLARSTSLTKSAVHFDSQTSEARRSAPCANDRRRRAPPRRRSREQRARIGATERRARRADAVLHSLRRV